LNVEERFINYKVFRYLWLVNMLRTKRKVVLFVKKNISLQMEEVKLVQKNVERKESFSMIRNILNSIQRFQEKHLKIGNRKIKRELIKEQENDGKEIIDLKLEIKPMNLLEKKEFQNMENVNYVESCPIEKCITLNTQRRILY